MRKYNGWKILCVVLLVALVAIGSLCLLPRDTTVYGPQEPGDPAKVARVEYIGFGRDEGRVLEATMLRKVTKRCEDEFVAANLMPPSEVIAKLRPIVRPSTALWLKDSRTLGFVYKNMHDDLKSEFSSGLAQAGAVPDMREGHRLTLDGRVRIYIHDSAYFGESFWFRRASLSDVLTHELIHAGGQPESPGIFGPLQHDLAGFEPYERILNACR